ncbi:hypothetical protein NC652_000759 [Populus alba x Populus x berolinensis]|nr:hypothetical protein NC652_000759 [Populus alba x Populus x berolinensis]
MSNTRNAEPNWSCGLLALMFFDMVFTCIVYSLTLTFAIFLGDATEVLVFQTSCLLAMLLWAFTAICWELSIDALGRIYSGGNGVEDCLIREAVLRLSDHPLASFKSL